MKIRRKWKGGEETENKTLSQDEILRLRQQTGQRAYILNPRQVTETDEVRIRKWAATVMGKHESKFTQKWKDRQIVTSGEVEPEAIDVRAIYPHDDLNWIIWKNKTLWSFMLLSKHRMLFNIDFAKI